MLEATLVEEMEEILDLIEQLHKRVSKLENDKKMKGEKTKKCQ